MVHNLDLTHYTSHMRLKLFLAILGVLILASVSEAIFQLNNNPSIQYLFQPYFARFFIKSTLPELAFKQIGKVADYKLQNANLKVSESLNIPNLSKNRELKKGYVVFLNENKNDLLNSTDYNFWSKSFYKLGLIAHQNNEPDLVTSFWQSAINFSPQWSYYHIELANYFLFKGLTNDSAETLTFCLKFEYPRQHCQEFIKNNLERNTHEKVGFLEKTIEGI